MSVQNGTCETRSLELGNSNGSGLDSHSSDNESSQSSDHHEYTPPRKVYTLHDSSAYIVCMCMFYHLITLTTLGDKIGKGSHADVFEAKCTDCKHYPQCIALKCEPSNSSSPSIRPEFDVLTDLGSIDGIPNCYFYLEENGTAVMALKSLGPSLKTIFSRYVSLSLL